MTNAGIIVQFRLICLSYPSEKGPCENSSYPSEKGTCPALPGSGQLVLGHLGPLLGLLQLLLTLAELGQVQGGYLLGLLNLLLVHPDLLLQLAGQLAHPVLVLPVFVLLELQLLNPPLRLLVPLVGIGGPCLAVAQLDFQFPDASF